MTTASAPTRRLLAITAAPAARPRTGPSPGLAATVAAATAPVRAKATPGRLPLCSETTQRVVARPLPPPSEVLVWIGSEAATAGQPVNVTVSAATHDAHIHVASAVAFRTWCAHLNIPPSAWRWSATILGPMVEATTTRTGWAMHVRLFGPAAEELR